MKFNYIDSVSLSSGTYYIKKTIDLIPILSKPKSYTYDDSNLSVEYKQGNITFINKTNSFQFETLEDQYIPESSSTDLISIQLDLKYPLYVYNVVLWDIPVPDCLPELKSVSERMFLIIPRNITFNLSYPKELGLSNVLNITSHNITTLRGIFQRDIISKRTTVSFADFEMFLNQNKLFYRFNHQINPSILSINKIIRNDQILYGYNIDSSNNFLKQIDEPNFLFTNTFVIENPTKSFSFNFVRLDNTSFVPHNQLQLEPTDYLLKISNIRFGTKPHTVLFDSGSKSYYVGFPLLNNLLDIINNKIGMISVDKFFELSPDFLTFANCEENNIQNQFLIFNTNSNAKLFVESYLRKSQCMTKLFESDIFSIANHHQIVKYLFAIFISSKYFRIVLNINKPSMFRFIPKYIEEHVDNLQFHIRGFNLQTKKLQYDEQFKLDPSNFSIIFDTGNDSTTFISTKLLKKINYMPDTPSFRFESAPVPYNSLTANNKIIGKFTVASSGINDQNPVISNTYMAKVKFKFIDPKLNMDKEYELFAYIKDSGTFDLLIGHRTLKMLFDDGYSIKYNVPKRTFIPFDSTPYNGLLSKDTINIVSNDELNIANNLLGSVQLELINPSLLTQTKINQLITSAKTFFESKTQPDKIATLKLLFPNYRRVPQTELQYILDLFYSRLNIDPSNKIDIGLVLA